MISRTLKLAALALALALALAACGQSPDPAELEAELAAFDAERHAELSAPDGWLATVGLIWLEPGTYSFGSGDDVDLRVDSPGVPTMAGSLRVEDGQVSFEPADGGPGTRLWPVEDGSDAVVEDGPLRFYVIQRERGLALRVKDAEAPARVGFVGVERYPVDPGWVIDARFERSGDRTQKVLDVTGAILEMPVAGTAIFQREGRSHRLDLLEQSGDPELFLMFRDRSSGRGTFGGGRYLYVPPTDGDTIRLDLNRAENPPCAFTHHATCPLPPPQNTLDLVVDAGELDYTADERAGNGVHP